MPAEDPGWVPALNLDPRYRAAGGLGGRVIRKHQDQVHAVGVGADRRCADGQRDNPARTDGGQGRRRPRTRRRSRACPLESATALASPVFSKIMGSPKTLHALTLESRLPRAALSPAFRKLLRPRGRLARRLLPPDDRAGAIATLVPRHQRWDALRRAAAPAAEWRDPREREGRDTARRMGSMAAGQRVVARSPAATSGH